MVRNVKCICIAPKIFSLFSVPHKSRKCQLVPWRSYSKRNSEKQSHLKPVKNSSDELPPLTGLDDPNFGEYLKRDMFDINMYKTGFKNILLDTERFYNEIKQDYQEAQNPDVSNKENRVDILYKFETPEEVQKFTVHTDSSFDKGYSSASFNLTENKTAVFSGNLDTTVPKCGTLEFSGYANITGPKQQRAFHRYKPYDWRRYTHLVLKIRGDGRTYLVILHTSTFYEEIKTIQYCHQLFTRGGPYWQIVKIPFNHFILMSKGSFGHVQDGRTTSNEIMNMGITSAALEGPFKLEIDYIGLEFKPHQKRASPFELYELHL